MQNRQIALCCISIAEIILLPTIMPKPPKWSRQERWLLVTPLLVPILFFVARQLRQVHLPSLPARTPTPVPVRVIVMPTPVVVPTPTPRQTPIPSSTLPPSATIQLDGLSNWAYGRNGGHALVLKFSPRGHWIAGTLTEKTLGLWDVKTGKLEMQFPIAETIDFMPMAFSPDETQLVVAYDRKKEYWVFDLQSAVFAPRILKVSTAKFGDTFTQVSFAPDGKIFAVARQDNDVDLVSLATGQLIYHLDLSTVGGGMIDENTITHSPCVSFSFDGRVMATGGRDEAIALWNVKTGALIKILGGHSGAVCDIKFSPDGKWLISGGIDEMKVWDMKKRSLRHSFSGYCFALDFSSDNRHVVGLGGGNLSLNDALTGTILHVISEGDFAGKTDIKFAPDGKSVLCSGSYRLPARWDIRPILKMKS